MPNYTVTDLGPLNHDGVIFEDGAQVTLEEAAAAALLALGVITPGQEKGAKPKSSTNDAG
jgi:hypothetical protein